MASALALRLSFTHIFCRTTRAFKAIVLSPEGATYHSPGQRPGVEVHAIVPQALKGRNKAAHRSEHAVENQEEDLN